MIVYNSCPGCGDENISHVLSAKDETVSGEEFEIWECKNCSLRFTQNIPEQENIGRYYQSENYISHSDTKKGFVNNLYHIIRKHTLVQKKNLIETNTGKKTIAVANPQVPEVNAIRMELEEFKNAILNNSKPIVSEMDGLMAMDVAHQILDRIGKNVITHA